MKKKSILILSASSGAGHTRAADALVRWAGALDLPVETRHEDILDFTLPLFRKIYREIQYAVVGQSPELWGYLYKKAEIHGKQKNPPPFIRLFNQFNYKKYLKLLQDVAADAVICTHFLPYAAVAEDLRNGRWNIPFFVVTTDYDMHSLWANPSVRRFFVSTEEAAWTLASHGIDRARISVTGIPVHPQFSNGQAGAEDTSPDRSFRILVLASGYTTRIVLDLADALARLCSTYGTRKFHIDLVCGRNERLYLSAKRVATPPNLRWRRYQFITYVDRLMDSADLVITKSGGLIVSESLAKGLPMVIFDPVPGQEGHNAAYLMERGAACAAYGYAQLEYKIKQLIDDPSLLARMKESTATIAKPLAAKAIWAEVLVDLGSAVS